MSRIGPKDTKPELTVRRLLHRLGYRYRLHRRDLPGTPDIVFVSRRKVIFVHGCFWHRHPGCKAASSPKTRTEFWERKFHDNVERDARKMAALRGLGWEPLVVWSCEIRDEKALEQKLVLFLDGDRPGVSVSSTC
jgi:DNA mismatch endonuclease (patch repair protein)